MDAAASAASGFLAAQAGAPSGVLGAAAGDAIKSAAAAAQAPGRMLTAAKGLEGFGAAFEALGSVASGYSKAREFKAQANVAQQNALAANRSAAQQSDAILREGRQMLAAHAAGAAQNGLGFSGSVTDSLDQGARHLAADSNNAVYAGRVKANDHNNQSLAARASAKNAVTAGWVGAATTLLKAGARMMLPGAPIG